jgi:hypothetical protein
LEELNKYNEAAKKLQRYYVDSKDFISVAIINNPNGYYKYTIAEKVEETGKSQTYEGIYLKEAEKDEFRVPEYLSTLNENKENSHVIWKTKYNMYVYQIVENKEEYDNLFEIKIADKYYRLVSTEENIKVPSLIFTDLSQSRIEKLKNYRTRTEESVKNTTENVPLIINESIREELSKEPSKDEELMSNINDLLYYGGVCSGIFNLFREYGKKMWKGNKTSPEYKWQQLYLQYKDVFTLAEFNAILTNNKESIQPKTNAMKLILESEKKVKERITEITNDSKIYENHLIRC